MQEPNPLIDGACAAPLVVLDTNVVLDWLVFRDPRVAALAAPLEAGALRWISCPAMRRELAHMLGHRSLARWAPDAEAALAAHDRHARLVPDPTPAHRPRCSDADDQVFVDLALALPARWLLSHDRALLKLARRMRSAGVDVLTPMAWAGQVSRP